MVDMAGQNRWLYLMLFDTFDKLFDAFDKLFDTLEKKLIHSNII